MALDGLKVDLTVVLGKTRMPLQRALRISRGAVVTLDGAIDDEVEGRGGGVGFNFDNSVFLSNS